MSDGHGRCRAEIETRYAQCGPWDLATAGRVLADALDRIEAKLDAETTASQAARQTAERLIVAERDEWKRLAETAEHVNSLLRDERDNARAELATARAMDDAQRVGLARLLAMEERYRVRRFPEERPDSAYFAVGWPLAVLAWSPLHRRWGACETDDLVTGDLWCYAPLSPDTTHDAAPAATADDGRDRTDKADTPPVEGTGETTHDPAELLRGWERHGSSRWGLGVAGSVLLIEHRLARLEAALDAAGVKWEEE